MTAILQLRRQGGQTGGAGMCSCLVIQLLLSVSIQSLGSELITAQSSSGTKISGWKSEHHSLTRTIRNSGGRRHATLEYETDVKSV